MTIARPLWRARFIAAGALAVATCAGPSSPTSTAAPPSLEIGVAANALARVQPGGTLQLWARATVANGTTMDITNVAQWMSAAPAVATVDRGGTLSAAQAGATDVSATFQGATKTLHVVVGPPGCESSTISPPALSFSPLGRPSCSDDAGDFGQRIYVKSPVTACHWTATIDVPWMSFGCQWDPTKSSFEPLEPATGLIQYTVRSNNTPVMRTGHVIVKFDDGTTVAHTVTVDAPPCSYVVTPESASYPKEGGAGFFDLKVTPESCHWKAGAATPVRLVGPGTSVEHSDMYGASTVAIGIGSTRISYTVDRASLLNPYEITSQVYVRGPRDGTETFDILWILFTVTLARP